MSDNSSYIKRVLTAMKDFDTLDIESFEDAVKRLVNNLAYELNSLVDIYEKYEFKTSASVVDFTDKKLEQDNENFLGRLYRYVEGVIRAFDLLGSRYANLCGHLSTRLAKTNETKNTAEVLREVMNGEEKLKTAVLRVSKFSKRKQKEAEDLKITHLKNYEYQFKQLKLFEELTIERVFDLLVTKGKVEKD